MLHYLAIGATLILLVALGAILSRVIEPNWPAILAALKGERRR